MSTHRQLPNNTDIAPWQKKGRWYHLFLEMDNNKIKIVDGDPEMLNYFTMTTSNTVRSFFNSRIFHITSLHADYYSGDLMIVGTPYVSSRQSLISGSPRISTVIYLGSTSGHLVFEQTELSLETQPTIVYAPYGQQYYTFNLSSFDSTLTNYVYTNIATTETSVEVLTLSINSSSVNSVVKTSITSEGIITSDVTGDYKFGNFRNLSPSSPLTTSTAEFDSCDLYIFGYFE